MDEQELGVTFNLAADEDQKRVEAPFGDTELLIPRQPLDPGFERARERRGGPGTRCNPGCSSRKGLSVLILEHAGRNGEARGTSKRQDVLDTVIQLKRGEDYQL